MANSKHEWKYCSIGGVVRVRISNGEDLAHLGELDQKLWTVLSCPTKGLEFDQKTLELLDSDNDGKIRVPEMVAAAQWLTSVIKDKDSILKCEKTLSLDNIDTSVEAGKKLYDSAKRILANLGLEKNELALEDVEDTTKIFASSKSNGDGVITAMSADDEALKATIGQIVSTVGSAMDRSGELGVTADLIEQFYAAAAAYAEWQAAADKDATVFPFGADTDAAFAAVEAVRLKVEDFFMRCKLIAFDADASAAVDVSVDRIGSISAGNLTEQVSEIAQYPLARPTKDCILPFDAVNPAWKAAMDTVKNIIPEFKDKASVTEEEWQAAVAKFVPFIAWKDAMAGTEVKALGIDEVKKILADDHKAALLELIDADKAVEAEANGIDEVCKLVRFYAFYARLLNNYITFVDFYRRDPENLSVFDAGKLYIDERCCDLCVRVASSAAHADIDSMSGIFLIYCTCTSKVKNETMEIVAALTAGSVSDIRPGKNGIFYDRSGQDWDAVVTKVVDNPISIMQAFWSPYRKLAKFITEKIDKSAAEKDANAVATLQTKADEVEPGAKKLPFDISKAASTFAVVGVAVGALGAGIGVIIKAFRGLVWWKYFVIIAALMLVISAPACFIAWRKLRKRNLGPVLNANGWAVNSSVLINILFGRALTSVARYPKVSMNDPYSQRVPAWRRCLRWLIALLVIAFGVMYFTDNLKFIGIERHKKATEVEAVAEPAAEEAAVEDTVAVEAAAEEVPAEAAE